MDFDTLIAFVFFLLFFVLPSIIKQIQLKKKKKTAPAKKKKKSFFGGFGKIGDQIRKFLRDLERQAQAQKKAARQDENIWDTLVEDEWEDEPALQIQVEKTLETESRSEAEYGVHVPAPPVPEPQIMVGMTGIQPEKRISKTEDRLRFRKDPLQNAIVLSEIFAKPAALKNKQW